MRFDLVIQSRAFDGGVRTSANLPKSAIRQVKALVADVARMQTTPAVMAGALVQGLACIAARMDSDGRVEVSDEPDSEGYCVIINCELRKLCVMDPERIDETGYLAWADSIGGVDYIPFDRLNVWTG